MRRAIRYCGLIAACLVACAVGSAGTVAAAGAPRDARIAGRVLVCNAPGHCFTRRFKVGAIDSVGQTVASTVTTGPHNAYRLGVAPGQYKLVAKSPGLVCRASAVAVAHKTTRRNITCPVP